MLTQTTIFLAAVLTIGAAGVAQASAVVQPFGVAQASTGLGATGRPAMTNTFSPQRPSSGAPSGVNPNNPQDMINRSNPQDRTSPTARNPQDLAR
jgi:hypothetical protein